MNEPKEPEYKLGSEVKKHGSQTFYKLLERMSDTHNKKSHDYASNSDPCGNYHFAGMMSQLFKSPNDAGFVGRIGEKLYRLANLENEGKFPLNETIEDTEIDILTIMALWISDRIDRRDSRSTIFDKDLVSLAKITYVPFRCTYCQRIYTDRNPIMDRSYSFCSFICKDSKDNTTQSILNSI